MKGIDRIRGWVAGNIRLIKRVAATSLCAAVIIAVLWFSWRFAGPMPTVVYVMMFLLGLGFLPGLITTFGSMMPMTVGRIEFALGQLAFGHGWLVQHPDGWEMHPGRTNEGTSQVYIDEEWRDIVDTDNQSYLGWQPFGILLKKDDETLIDARYDPEGEVRRERKYGTTVADGGDSVQRAGIDQATPPAETGDGWVIDLKRYWSPDLERIADIELIEKVEEITMRAQALGGRNETKRIIIGSIAGLVLGVGTGYVIMVGF